MKRMKGRWKKITQPLGFLLALGLIFGFISSKMGMVNMLSTLMNTAYALLLDTVFYIMAIAVLAGAISALFSEFGVIALLNKLLSRSIEAIYELPGASAVGVFTTYLSDNPAILTLASDNNFRRFFKKYQLPALTNIGTSFGMGLIITTFMMGLGKNFGTAVLVGNLGLCNLRIDTNAVFVLICFTMRYAGLSLLQMPLTNYGLSAVPPELSGHASSLYNWGKQVVQVVSTNILTVILSLNLNRYYWAAGNTGVPVEGTMEYRLAAIQAVNTDYLYLAVFLVISLGCTFLIKPQKKR